MTPEQRSLAARLAIHARWSGEPDPAACTAAAREAFLTRFDRELDPDGILEPAERARRAAHARQAYFARLALRSSQVRAKRKKGGPNATA